MVFFAHKGYFKVFCFMLSIFLLFAVPSRAEEVPAKPVIKETSKPTVKGIISEPETTITAIVIEGNVRISSKEILSIIVSKIGDQLLEPKLMRDQQAVYDMGYFSNVKVETQNFEGGVKLVFRVLENPEIKEIEITGNKIVPTDKISSLMETKIGNILNSKMIYGDVMAINNYYNEELEYFYPNHVIDVDWTESGRLTLKIIDGLTIKSIEVKGNTVVPTADLMKLIKSKPGDLLNRKLLNEDSTRIEELYRGKDYLVSMPQPTIDFEKGTIILDVGEAVIEDIKFEGNTKTKASFLMKATRIRTGEVLRNRRVKRDYERLQNLQIFESIEPTFEPGSAPGKVVLVWRVKEQKTGMATFGLGYGGGAGATSRAGLFGTISYTERNFGGRGQRPAVSWQRGVNIDTIALSFTDPAINERSDSLGVSFYNSNYSELRQPVYGTDPVDYAYYDDHRAGGILSFGRYLTDDLQGIISAKREEIRLNKNQYSFYDPVGLAQGNINAMTFAGVYDTRDDIFDPYEGALANVSWQTTGGILKGSYSFNKYQLEFRKYFSLKKGMVFAFRVWGGYIQGADAPATEYFYIGGTDTIRAYFDNSFFGNRMALMNAEFRFPIAKIQYLKGCIFADMGNAWSPGEISTFKKDAGVGIRLVFPKFGLGVIRVDYAVRGGGQGRFAVGIGPSF